jgi:uncharacterized membrane protein (DUF373 family)
MFSRKVLTNMPRWHKPLEKFEEFVVAALCLLMALLVMVMLAVVGYIFLTRVWKFAAHIVDFSELQKASLHSFAGILLVLLGLELLETVKIYFREHSVRVEVILLLGLIAMGRHVLEIDLNTINPIVLFGFSSLVLALAVSYFFVKRAQSPVPGTPESRVRRGNFRARRFSLPPR